MRLDGPDLRGNMARPDLATLRDPESRLEKAAGGERKEAA